MAVLGQGKAGWQDPESYPLILSRVIKLAAWQAAQAAQCRQAMQGSQTAQGSQAMQGSQTAQGSQATQGGQTAQGRHGTHGSQAIPRPHAWLWGPDPSTGRE
ncbi:hypothetical protein KXV33_008362 [Aspergillus fumigatus]|nr:hypothetical protein KXV33_008362 [Aspergillus fumigatus]